MMNNCGVLRTELDYCHAIPIIHYSSFILHLLFSHIPKVAHLVLVVTPAFLDLHP